MHKTANVLAKLPNSQRPKANRALQEIWMAETKAGAELAFDAFIESHTPKYEKAAGCSATIWMGTQRQSGWPFRRSRRDDDCRGATITQAIFA